MGSWLVIVGSAKFVDELAKATDSELSLTHALIDVRIRTLVSAYSNWCILQNISADYTLGEVHDDEVGPSTQ